MLGQCTSGRLLPDHLAGEAGDAPPAIAGEGRIWSEFAIRIPIPNEHAGRIDTQYVGCCHDGLRGEPPVGPATHRAVIESRGAPIADVIAVPPDLDAHILVAA